MIPAIFFRPSRVSRGAFGHPPNAPRALDRRPFVRVDAWSARCRRSAILTVVDGTDGTHGTDRRCLVPRRAATSNASQEAQRSFDGDHYVRESYPSLVRITTSIADAAASRATTCSRGDSLATRSSRFAMRSSTSATSRLALAVAWSSSWRPRRRSQCDARDHSHCLVRPLAMRFATRAATWSHAFAEPRVSTLSLADGWSTSAREPPPKKRDGARAPPPGPRHSCDAEPC